MLLSHKRDPTIQLQVADSVRYREAVSRLKRILYNRPSTYEYTTIPFTWKETKYFHHEPPRIKEEFEKEIPDKNLDENQKSFSSVFEMIKRQDDLIAQLEKENLFLKTELVSTAEASKEIALQNESFRKRLTDTLIQMETSPDLSSLTDADEKADEVINCLKEEREKLVECIKLQEETISTLRKRETEAIDKVKQAVSLAEDSQRLSDKVRESGDQNRKDLQHEVEDAFEKIQILQQQLHKAQDRERANEMLLRDHEKNLSRIEEDSRDKDLSLKKRELDYQNQIEDLRRSLKEAEEANERLEKVLQEQRNTSEATFKRLEALLDRRNLETESFTKRRKSLEKQITDLKQENQRLLQAINDLAKERTSNTDDVKYATQVSTSLPSSTKNELNEIKSIIEDHQNSISFLQEEVLAVRQEMAKEIDGLRNNMGELFSSLDKGREESKESKLNSDFQKKRTDFDTPRQEIYPFSYSYSDGYESLRDFSRKDSQSGSAFREIIVSEEPEEKKDRSTKILTIPFTDDRKIGSKRITGNDMNERGRYEENKGTVSEEEEDFLSDTMERSELESSTDQISSMYIRDDKKDDMEISKKEIKKNFEEEKDKDESLPENEENDRDESVMICDVKYNGEKSIQDKDSTSEDNVRPDKEKGLQGNEEKDKNDGYENNEERYEDGNLKDIDYKKKLEDEALEDNEVKYKDQSFEEKERDEYLEDNERDTQSPIDLNGKEEENAVNNSDKKYETEKVEYVKESLTKDEEEEITTKIDTKEKDAKVLESPNKNTENDGTLKSESPKEQSQEVEEERDKISLKNNEQPTKPTESSETTAEDDKEREAGLKNKDQTESDNDIQETKETSVSEEVDEKDATEKKEEIKEEKLGSEISAEDENLEEPNAVTEEKEETDVNTLSEEKAEEIQSKTDDQEGDSGGKA